MVFVEAALKNFQAQALLAGDLTDSRPETAQEAWGLILQLSRAVPRLPSGARDAAAVVFGMDGRLDLNLMLLDMETVRIARLTEFLSVGAEALGTSNVEVFTNLDSLVGHLDAIGRSIRQAERFADSALRIVVPWNSRNAVPRTGQRLTEREVDEIIGPQPTGKH